MQDYMPMIMFGGYFLIVLFILCRCKDRTSSSSKVRLQRTSWHYGIVPAEAGADIANSARAIANCAHFRRNLHATI